MAPASQTGMNKRWTHKNAYSPSPCCMHVQHRHRDAAWREIWANLLAWHVIRVATDDHICYRLTCWLLSGHVVILFIKCQKKCMKSARHGFPEPDVTRLQISFFCSESSHLRSCHQQMLDIFAYFLSTLYNSCSYDLKINIKSLHTSLCVMAPEVLVFTRLVLWWRPLPVRRLLLLYVHVFP